MERAPLEEAPFFVRYEVREGTALHPSPALDLSRGSGTTLQDEVLTWPVARIFRRTGPLPALSASLIHYALLSHNGYYVK